MISSPYHW